MYYWSFSWLIMSCLKRNCRGSSNLTKSSKFKIIVKKSKKESQSGNFYPCVRCSRSEPWAAWQQHEEESIRYVYLEKKKKNWLLKNIMMLSELTFTDHLPNISGIVLTTVLVQIHCVLPVRATFFPTLQVRKLRLIEVK